jgi:glycosyltransferase involved in cell wall biosynthesis
MEHAIVGTSGARFAVVHQHTIWTAISRVTIAWRKKTGQPTIITPHGMLQAWCLQKSSWKKRLALLGYERKNFCSASSFHALSQVELNDCRDFGQRNPVAVIPNGVSNSWLASEGSSRQFRARFDIAEEKRVALFLSRITPKKGLSMLFQALGAMKNSLDNWLFLIAGVDEFHHQAECERCVAELRLEPYVRFIGPLYDEMKRDAFAAADVVVLPSLSEGAPIVVLEALGAGVPVLTTKASPWEDLATYQCGWWSDISVAGIRTALDEATALPRAELSRMGARGKRLVASQYSWLESARKTIALYKWLLAQGEQPSFVSTK